MTLAQALNMDTWAEGAYLEIDRPSPPVDLIAIAKIHGVRQIRLRSMIHDGALVPVPGGFEVYIHDLREQDLDLTEHKQPEETLSARQRFTLAHEIAHTKFYSMRGRTPAKKAAVKKYNDPDGIGLEKICNRAAARLLVPKQLIKNDIHDNLGGQKERIDSAFVRSMATTFRASAEVVLKRIRVAEPENLFRRCIVLAREEEGQLKIRAWYRGATLLSAFRPIEEFEFKPVTDWLPDLPSDFVEPTGPSQTEVSVRGRRFTAQKFPVGRGKTFLLQLDESNETQR